MTDAEPLLTVTEVADRLRVTPATVVRWVNARRITGYKFSVGRAGWRIPTSEIERLLDEGRSERQP